MSYTRRMTRRSRIAHSYTADDYRQVIEALIVKGDGCWTFEGHHTERGYAVHRSTGQLPTRLVHRLMYLWHVGPIPDGLHLDHLCSNNGCVRPDHLEAVTQQENNRRAAERYWQGTCRNGHDLSEPGAVYVSPQGRRTCHACQKNRSNVAYRRRTQGVD